MAAPLPATTRECLQMQSTDHRPTKDVGLQAIGLYKAYSSQGRVGHEELIAVDGVDVTVSKQATLGVVGISGSGKSTLARCILQFERPDRGRVVLNGKDLTNLRGKDLREARRALRAVFQDPINSLDPRLSIWQSVMLGMYGISVDQDEREARTADALPAVGLSKFIHHRPGEISGDQAQRATITRTIISHPNFTILDKPTSALDVSIQAQIVTLLQKLKNKLGIGYVFISHALSLVATICDYLVVLRAGRIVEVGTTREVLQLHRVHTLVSWSSLCSR